MRHLNLTADQLIEGLLHLSETEQVSLLDSCGVRHLGSHLLIAGIHAIDVIEVSNEDPGQPLAVLHRELFRQDVCAMFTLSYDFGRKLQRVATRRTPTPEPDLFVSLFDVLIVHDYDTGQSSLLGNSARFDEIANLLQDATHQAAQRSERVGTRTDYNSCFTRDEYLAAVETIREYIRAGDTYQTNLTQQITVPASTLKTQNVFRRLRDNHPAPFAAFFTRGDSTVISASPERFFSVDRHRRIEASPIKGTRPRGRTRQQDAQLRSELLSSEKDIAENTMIVDLIRNDLGRVCEFGSVVVEKLCDIEEHPSLFHLVSTVSGRLEDGTNLGDILTAMFPCGSITGAPKIRTMQIIDEVEPVSRGLSMGAIGFWIPESWEWIGDTLIDLSVAIRTMVVRRAEITFNVGGGVVIDSDPVNEYDESLLKAKALLEALGK